MRDRYITALEGKPLTVHTAGKKRVIGTITSVEIAEDEAGLFATVRAEVTDPAAQRLFQASVR